MPDMNGSDRIRELELWIEEVGKTISDLEEKIDRSEELTLEDREELRASVLQLTERLSVLHQQLELLRKMANSRSARERLFLEQKLEALTAIYHGLVVRRWIGWLAYLGTLAFMVISILAG